MFNISNSRSPDVDLITLWDIEMPPPSAGHVPDATRDSQYAAAAAIAILARGLVFKKFNLRFKTFKNSVFFQRRRIFDVSNVQASTSSTNRTIWKYSS